MAKPRIVIADDHGLIIEGIRRVLEPEFEIVGVACDGHQLVALAEATKPDLVLLDVVMPNLNGIEAGRQIKKSLPDVKLVFLTQRADWNYVQAAFRAEASGYLLKQAMVGELAPALREVLAGRFYVSPLISRGSPEVQPNPLHNPSELFGASLTRRQREVLQLVAEGKTAKEVAGLLSISSKTVEFHKAAIMTVLGLRTTAELTRYALEQGIVGD